MRKEPAERYGRKWKVQSRTLIKCSFLAIYIGKKFYSLQKYRRVPLTFQELLIAMRRRRDDTPSFVPYADLTLGIKVTEQCAT